MKNEINFKVWLVFDKLESIFIVIMIYAWASAGFFLAVHFAFHLESHYGTSSFLVGCAGFLLAYLLERYNKCGNLFVAWKIDLGMKLKVFPVTSEEQASLSEWAKDQLGELARKATGAFHTRDLRADEIPILMVASQLILDKLPEIRKNRKVYLRDRKKAEWRLREAEKIAEQASKRYLRVWDFFTKDKPDGLGILKNIDDPEAFRKSSSFVD